MKKNLLIRKILCSVLAAGMGSIVMPLAAQAASGGKIFEQEDGSVFYEGVKEDNGYHVIIESGDKFYRVVGMLVTENQEVKGVTTEVQGGTIEYLYGVSLGFDGDITNNIINNNLSVTGNYTTVDTAVGINTMGTAVHGNIKNNSVTVAGVNSIKDILGIMGYAPNIEANSVIVNNSSVQNIVGASIILSTDEMPIISNNTVKVTGSELENGMICGVIVTDSSNVSGNDYNLLIEGNCVEVRDSTVAGDIYAVYIRNGSASVINNSVTLAGTTDVSNANIYGSNKSNSNTFRNSVSEDTGNTLIIDGWSGSTKSVQNFDTISFENINWKNGGTVLKITEDGSSSLSNTKLIYENMVFSGGTDFAVNDSMNLIQGNNLGVQQDNIQESGSFNAGVAVSGTGKAEVTTEGDVTYTITSVEQNIQTMLVAENRAVAAAFVNQGTDLISDSLDTLSRDGNYGVKTFAAVHGNRSKYDVNSDIKINGWSSIVGVGNEKNVGNGDFSWGVFYENGSGNYRTYNEFNNEFFRGDGSLVYNGGGIAARYEQDNGVYAEGSLRAGMLKSEMSDALKDGAGNSYGYKSESSYYGAHLGVGKVITLDDNKDLDIYGKFFHTYTDGESFTVAGDKFEFDSITSDRLRVGARLTTNKKNKVSTYYGLAYEYEFNGDAQMRAQNMSAPEQSLQGSSYMAEIGLDYKPDEDSPWSFDLNMRGYAGEREGGSFNVQATYAF